MPEQTKNDANGSEPQRQRLGTLWRRLRHPLLLTLCLLTTSCATTSPDRIDAREARRALQAHEGVVLSVRPVTVAHRPSGAGAAVGAMVGASHSRDAHGRQLYASGDALSALLGLLIGQAVEQAFVREKGLELLVGLDGGSCIAVVQGSGERQLFPGDRVVLVGMPGAYRVVAR